MFLVLTISPTYDCEYKALNAFFRSIKLWCRDFREPNTFYTILTINYHQEEVPFRLR